MAPQSSTNPSHLEPSPLGTKEYWDSLYTTEITNHKYDPSNVGTIWFDDSLAEVKVHAFLSSQIIEDTALGLSKETCSFLDLGTGNGHFLFRLREGAEEDSDDDSGPEPFGGRMLGVDYSQKSIDFARRIAQEKRLGKGQVGEVEFELWDIMNQDPNGIVLTGAHVTGWDVVLDKGTFDAISLSGETDAAGRRVCEGYKERVVPLVKEGGILLVTSCNWTEQELRTWFEGPELKYLDTIKYRSFSFGGQKGQTISSVCFRKQPLS